MRPIEWPEAWLREAAEAYSAGVKSTTELAKEFGVSYQAVAVALRRIGVVMTEETRLRHLRRRRKGQPSHRKGAKHTPASRAFMSRIHRGHPATTRGKVYTEQERANIVAGLQRHYAKLRADGRLLSDDEKTIRTRVRNTVKRFTSRILRMARVRKDARAEVLLGYTKADLRAHLEKQFRPGMSWADRGSFHVDHIIPVAWFLRRGIADPKVISALSNLQVLTPGENRRKNARYPEGLPA